jgi:hypothetical protein
MYRYWQSNISLIRILLREVLPVPGGPVKRRLGISSFSFRDVKKSLCSDERTISSKVLGLNFSIKRF